MKTLAHILVISILTLAFVGCTLGPPPSPYGERAGALGSSEPAAQQPIPSDVVDAAALPADLMTCDDFFGVDWDTPDLILLVQSTRGIVVLVQDGEMVCAGRRSQLTSRLAGLDLGPMTSLGGSWKCGPSMGTGGNANVGAVGMTDEYGDSNPLPANPAGSRASGINEDSNPLPASPAGGSASDDPTGDSNPLPANPSGSGSGATEDSNPLPAHSDDPSQTFLFSTQATD